MARLTFWIILACSLFSGYWFVATRALNNALSDGIAAAQADGWQIDYQGLETTGFPGDFDVSASDIVIGAADGQWAWQGPALKLQAPSTAPTRITIDLPQAQTLRLGDQTLRIASNKLSVSGATALTAALDFDAASITAQETQVRSSLGWQASVDDLISTATKKPDADTTYDIDLTTTGLTIPAALLADISPQGALSNTINSITLDSEVTLTTPLDRFSFDGQGADPALEMLRLSGLEVIWDNITISAAGNLDVDSEGVPNGRITIQTAQWEALIDIAMGTGAVDARIEQPLRSGARALVDGDGVLTLPITFNQGIMMMGFLPLGPAPRFR